MTGNSGGTRRLSSSLPSSVTTRFSSWTIILSGANFMPGSMVRIMPGSITVSLLGRALQHGQRRFATIPDDRKNPASS